MMVCWVLTNPTLWEKQMRPLGSQRIFAIFTHLLKFAFYRHLHVAWYTAWFCLVLSGVCSGNRSVSKGSVLWYCQSVDGLVISEPIASVWRWMSLWERQYFRASGGDSRYLNQDSSSPLSSVCHTVYRPFLLSDKNKTGGFLPKNVVPCRKKASTQINPLILRR